MINSYSHVIARQLDTAMVKRLILNQWWQITIMFIVILASSSALADRVQVNKNKISDLFEKEIDDKQATLKFIENSQKQSERGISSKGAVQELGVDEKELESKVSELNAINVNNLESKGQEERAKGENSYINQLEVDYLDPKIVNHKRDIDKISDASSKLMSRLMEGLRDLDIDCKTVKGDKELEPEYVIEIEKEHFKDTIYNQKFCEELRNEYSCSDSLILKCTKTGVRYKEWQDRVMYLGGFEFWFDYHGWTHTIKCRRGYWSVHMRQDLHLNLERRNMIANRLGVKLEQVEGGTAPWDGEGKITHVEGVHHVFQRYAINYKYRDSYPVCEEWAEEWMERCRLK